MVKLASLHIYYNFDWVSSFTSKLYTNKIWVYLTTAKQTFMCDDVIFLYILCVEL